MIAYHKLKYSTFDVHTQFEIDDEETATTKIKLKKGHLQYLEWRQRENRKRKKIERAAAIKMDSQYGVDLQKL